MLAQQDRLARLADGANQVRAANRIAHRIDGFDFQAVARGLLGGEAFGGFAAVRPHAHPADCVHR